MGDLHHVPNSWEGFLKGRPFASAAGYIHLENLDTHPTQNTECTRGMTDKPQRKIPMPTWSKGSIGLIPSAVLREILSVFNPVRYPCDRWGMNWPNKAGNSWPLQRTKNTKTWGNHLKHHIHKYAICPTCNTCNIHQYIIQ